MKPSISTHFENMQAPLTNVQWSWGAQRPDGKVILRAWQDRRRVIDGKTYRQLLNPDWQSNSAGFAERARHIELLRAGAPGYMVILTAVDTTARPRRIQTYNSTVVVPIGELVEIDGQIWGECLRPVPVEFLEIPA
ncbi:hypothetical protein AO361_05975 [Pseudomonas fluorescens]|jgi:hypothetical protein|uniref:hypothetical protein n=1 Tax=Pseudomonas TaxID=286 RepID=UPI000708D50C|nr:MULTISPECIES: hypothetical protein [Pseudomonas]OOQ42739.1 hypothetical protein AO361_05975 [Pseudomonas fluorescens]